MSKNVILFNIFTLKYMNIFKFFTFFYTNLLFVFVSLTFLSPHAMILQTQLNSDNVFRAG